MPEDRMNRRKWEIYRMLVEMGKNKKAFSDGEFTREQLRFAYDFAIGKGTTEFYGMIESLEGGGVIKKTEGIFELSKPNYEQLINDLKKAVGKNA